MVDKKFNSYIGLGSQIKAIQIRENCKENQSKTATSFFLPHQNLAKSHHLSSGAKDSKPLKYINTDIRKQNIYDYD